jgi:hypothetical protein
MRNDLEAQRLLVEELQMKCAELEDMLGAHQAELAATQADNVRLAARLKACACE